MQLVVDGSDAASANVALGYASAVVRDFGAEPSRSAACGPPASRARRARPELVPRVFYNPDLRSRWFYVPAVLAMILMVMTMLLSAMGVVREKEIGTMEQLIVTPIRPWQLLVGKLAALRPHRPLPDVPRHRGHRLRLRRAAARLLRAARSASPLLFILSTLGLGLLVSTLVQNQQQAMMGAVFAAMVPDDLPLGPHLPDREHAAARSSS